MPEHDSEIETESHSNQANLIKRFSLPLYKSRFWIKVTAVFIFSNGIPFALSIIGLIIAWMPFWAGVRLWQASDMIEKAYLLGHKRAFYTAQNYLKTAFNLFGIFALISIILIAVTTLIELTRL